MLTHTYCRKCQTLAEGHQQEHRRVRGVFVRGSSQGCWRRARGLLGDGGTVDTLSHIQQQSFDLGMREGGVCVCVWDVTHVVCVPV